MRTTNFVIQNINFAPSGLVAQGRAAVVNHGGRFMWRGGLHGLGQFFKPNHAASGYKVLLHRADFATLVGRKGLWLALYKVKGVQNG